MFHTFFDAMLSTFGLQKDVEYRFKISLVSARTKKYAGEVFYDTMHVDSAVLLPYTNGFFSEDLEDAVLCICPFSWFADITLEDD
jgi:hypothetical protein